MYSIIVTDKSGDLHVDRVVESLRLEKVVTPIVIDTDTFGHEWHAVLHMQSPIESYLNISGINIFIKDIKSIWWRKPTPVNIKYMKDEMASFIFRETNDALYGFIWIVEALGGKVINHPFNNYKASIKPLQLLVASKAGLLVPETLITNLPFAAKTQLQSRRCISKGVSMSWAIDEGKNHSIFVKEVDSKKIAALDILNRCPATIQELIEKTCDVRIVCLENKAFCFRISDPSKDIDWRKNVYGGKIEYTFFEVDENFAALLNAYNDAFGLKFSVFDFVLSKNNELLFLESNPNGQWLWLDECADFIITKSIVYALSVNDQLSAEAMPSA